MVNARPSLGSGILVFFAIISISLTSFLPLEFGADFLTLILLLISAYVLSYRIGNWAWLGVATHIIGSIFYLFYISQASYVSDTQSYYSIGKELSRRVEDAWTGIGTGAVNYLSAMAQAVLPVSILGLAWMFSVFVIAATPSLKRSTVDSKVFLAFYFLSPNIVLWTGLLSKDMICVCAAIMSISAIVKLRQGDVVSWLVLLILSGAFAVTVRAYMAPILLFPHAVVLASDYFIKFRSGGAGKLPASVIAVIPLLSLGVFVGIQQMFQYVGIQDVSGVGDRLNLLNEQLFFGGSAIKLTPPEKVLVLFAPLPFRIRGVFDILASLTSLFYLYTLINLVFQVSNKKAKVDWGIILFSLTAIILWSFVFSNASNLGALERLKAQILPFLFLLFAHLSYSLKAHSSRSFRSD